MTDAQVAELERQGAEHGRRSRLAQGLPPQVEDPTTYAELARLLAQADERATRPGHAA